MRCTCIVCKKEIKELKQLIRKFEEELEIAFEGIERLENMSSSTKQEKEE